MGSPHSKPSDDISQVIGWLVSTESTRDRPLASVNGITMVLSSTSQPPASEEELRAVDPIGPTPPDLRTLWLSSRGLRLFEDRRCGQWGLIIWPPAVAAERTLGAVRERHQDHRPGDLLVGEFLGDSDVVLVRTLVGSTDDGSISVVLPMDPRAEWPIVAASFGDFLWRFIRGSGQKWWSS